VIGALDLRPRARVIFAACWLAGQAALVLSARTRADSAFAFRMFPEASTMEVHLWREVDGRWVPAHDGEWSARDAAGQLRHFSWRDRVRDRTLASVDSRVFASYGVDAQLARLGRALDDTADHLSEDAETTRLRAEVVVWRNGREPTTTVLESHLRRSP